MQVDKARTKFGFWGGLQMGTTRRAKPKAGDLFVSPPALVLNQARCGVTEQLREALLQVTAAHDQGLALTGTVPGVYHLVQAIEAILGYRLHDHCTLWDFARNSIDTMAEDDPQRYANLLSKEQVSAVSVASWTGIGVSQRGSRAFRSKHQARLWILLSLNTHSLFDALASLHRHGVTQRYYAENSVLRTSDVPNSFLFSCLYELTGLRFELSAADVDLFRYAYLQPTVSEEDLAQRVANGGTGATSPLAQPSPTTSPRPDDSQPKDGPVKEVPWHLNQRLKVAMGNASLATVAASLAAAVVTAARAQALTSGGQLPSSFDPKTMVEIPDDVVAVRRPTKRGRRRHKSVEGVGRSSASRRTRTPLLEAALPAGAEGSAEGLAEAGDEYSDASSVYSEAQRSNARSDFSGPVYRPSSAANADPLGRHTPPEAGSDPDASPEKDGRANGRRRSSPLAGRGAVAPTEPAPPPADPDPDPDPGEARSATASPDPEPRAASQPRAASPPVAAAEAGLVQEGVGGEAEATRDDDEEEVVEDMLARAIAALTPSPAAPLAALHLQSAAAAWTSVADGDNAESPGEPVAVSPLRAPGRPPMVASSPPVPIPQRRPRSQWETVDDDSSPVQFSDSTAFPQQDSGSPITEDSTQLGLSSRSPHLDDEPPAPPTSQRLAKHAPGNLQPCSLGPHARPPVPKGERDVELLAALEQVMQRLGSVYEEAYHRPGGPTAAAPALQQVQDLLAVLTAPATPHSAASQALPSRSPSHQSHHSDANGDVATSSRALRPPSVPSSPSHTPLAGPSPETLPASRSSSLGAEGGGGPRRRLPRLSFDPLGPPPVVPKAYDPPPAPPEPRYDPPRNSPTPGGPTAPVSKFSEKELAKLLSAAAIMKTELDIGNRAHGGHVYTHAFYGREAVTFFVQRKLAESRDDAVVLGLWLEQAGMFHHVHDKHHFQDTDLVFRFYNDERDADESPRAVSPLPFVSPLSAPRKAVSPTAPATPASVMRFSDFEVSHLYQCLQMLENEALWKLSRHPGAERDCFRGSEAVSWMVAHGYADSRREAVEFGRRLDSLGWIQHVEGRDSFQDGLQLYTIVRAKDGTMGTVTGPTTGLMMSRVSSVSSFTSAAPEGWADGVQDTGPILCQGYLQQLSKRLMGTGNWSSYFVLYSTALHRYPSKEDFANQTSHPKAIDLQQVVVSRLLKSDKRGFKIEQLDAPKAYQLVGQTLVEADSWYHHLTAAAVKAGRATVGQRQEAWEIQRWYPVTGWVPSVLPVRCPVKIVHDFELLERWIAQLGYSWIGEWRLAAESEISGDANGWLYASGFTEQEQFRPEMHANSYVRIRKWTRRCAPPPLAP